MASITQTITVRDSTVTSGDNRKTGLMPAWTMLKLLSDNTNVAAQPIIFEVALGQYKFTYDAEANGEAAGQIDAGSSLTNPSDRYIDVILTKDSSRIQVALPNAVPASSGGVPTANAGNAVQIDVTQVVPTSNTDQTVGDCLNAARAQGFGKWTFVGTTLTLYAPDGTTPVRTFTLDSLTNATTRQ